MLVVRRKISKAWQLFGLSLILCLGLGDGARAQVLEEIRLGAEDGRTRAVIEMDRSGAYQVFYLANPPRIVVDMTGLQVADDFRPNQQQTGLIRGIRLGQFNADVTRIVFDLAQSAELDAAFTLGPQGGAGDRLVLDLIAGSPARNGTILAEGAGTTQSFATVQTSANNPAATQGPSVVPISRGQDSCSDCATVMLPPPRPASIAPQRYIIVIDPGHGGRDPGAVGPGGVEEADVVLEMAKEISNELRANGAYDVYLTRGRDRFVPLAERAELARGRAADFFLSIHANANPDPGFRGFMVFTLSDEASDAYAEEVAARENRSEFGAIADISDDDVGSILGDILVRDTLNQSIDFASRLVQKLTGEVRLPRTPQRRAGFVVLKSVRMPSALLEIGHLTNPAEARALQSQSHRRKIAIAVREALDQHFANN